MGIFDSLTKNPSLILLAGVGIALFVFRDKISNFFSGISGGAQAVGTAGEISNTLLDNLQGNLTGTQNALEGINEFFSQPLPTLPEVQLPQAPSFNFEFPDIAGFFQGLFPGAPTPDPLPEQAFDSFIPTEINQPVSLDDFINNFLPAPISPNVQSGLDTGQQFQGGGVSFIGGSVNETPIEFLTVSQIVDQFGVSASQAVNILAQAQDNFGDFDFGTNTGSGIGSVTNDPIFNTQLPNQESNTSNPEFSGLTPEQIALMLTGGNISNF